ncbi:hypothetical protein IV203_021706 [Nitzschia inconspicua]|uniref:Uncharacterized protein n=1 Tax=Nitzschia inconspicua TaxID=303405 RepID=A0A9K3KIY0_9STRA|nr:hypothetical protein IV203_021706 [Nitzschia inconspicua]
MRIGASESNRDERRPRETDPIQNETKNHSIPCQHRLLPTIVLKLHWILIEYQKKLLREKNESSNDLVTDGKTVTARQNKTVQTFKFKTPSNKPTLQHVEIPIFTIVDLISNEPVPLINSPSYNEKNNNSMSKE